MSSQYARPAGIENERIWVDGCFDFTHHGHAGAMLQARQLGGSLYVGVHTDEDILLHKGPVVMRLDERLTAVDGCKWSTQSVPAAPYVTDPRFMARYGCKYVVHGDDITTDADGNDCYQGVKDLGMFIVVKRTPNISTTDLVGRMLLMTKAHHHKPLAARAPVLDHPLFAGDALARFESYASDCTGRSKGSAVYACVEADPALHPVVEAGAAVKSLLRNGAVYVDGGFDLFHPGHIEALRLVHEEARKANLAVVVGLHDDRVVNRHKGANYPIMNMFERSLCVLQCRYVDALVVGAPYVPTEEFLSSLPCTVAAVYHGPTATEANVYDHVQALYKELPDHKYSKMDTQFIVDRVLSNKKAYEERQARKGWKAETEKKLREEELKKAE